MTVKQDWMKDTFNEPMKFRNLHSLQSETNICLFFIPEHTFQKMGPKVLLSCHYWL